MRYCTPEREDNVDEMRFWKLSNEVRLRDTRERIFPDLRCKSGKIFFPVKVETETSDVVQIKRKSDTNSNR